VAGRIQFDREKAIKDAVLVFWRKGFAATSMEDIKAATGINESSLYNTFGNKKDLYIEALHAYGQTVKEQFAALPAEEQPAESIRMLLRQIAKLAAQREKAAGCMLMNSALELGAEHPDIVEIVQKSYGRIEQWFRKTLEQAQSKGEIPSDKDAKVLARYLTYSLQSMFTMGRTNPTEAFMTDVVETTLTILD
jgi:TetR/AcrR family transcriptional repressor of nem operon